MGSFELKELCSIGWHQIPSSVFHLLVRAADKRQETYVDIAWSAFAKNVTIIPVTIFQCHVVWKWLVLMRQDIQHLLSDQILQSWKSSSKFVCDLWTYGMNLLDIFPLPMFELLSLP